MQKETLAGRGGGTGACWVCADVRTGASRERVRSALDGMDVQPSTAYRRTLGVVRLIARDAETLDRGARIVAAL